MVTILGRRRLRETPNSGAFCGLFRALTPPVGTYRAAIDSSAWSSRRLEMRRFSARWIGTILLTVPMCGFAHATTTDAVQAWLLAQASALAPDARVAVELRWNEPAGAAACTHVEPALAPGAKAWGHTTVIVRCTQGAVWSVAAPAVVRVIGPAWVAARPIAAAETLGPGTLERSEIELSNAPPGTWLALASTDGYVATHAIARGQALRMSDARTTPVIANGDPVHVVIVGDGFNIAADGRALGAAADGETVRVQTAAGRVLSGTARGGRRVEVAL